MADIEAARGILEVLKKLASSEREIMLQHLPNSKNIFSATLEQLSKKKIISLFSTSLKLQPKEDIILLFLLSQDSPEEIKRLTSSALDGIDLSEGESATLHLLLLANYYQPARSCFRGLKRVTQTPSRTGRNSKVTALEIDRGEASD
jgi:hypothetical protein